ncbi:MAG: hypothetical protein U1F56_13715 [Rubrivivax sp.]
MSNRTSLHALCLAAALAVTTWAAAAAPAPWQAEPPYDYGLGQCVTLDRCLGADRVTDTTGLMDYGVGQYASLADYLNAAAQWARAGAGSLLASR